jgi:hypothetical protein
MTQIRQRPAGGAGRGDGAENVRTGHPHSSKTPRNRPTSTFIQVDEQYAIGADAHSWHILHRRNYKGGYKWEPILWYGSLEQCVHALREMVVRTCKAQTLADILAESERITSALCQALRPRFRVEVRRDA